MLQRARLSAWVWPSVHKEEKHHSHHPVRMSRQQGLRSCCAVVHLVNYVAIILLLDNFSTNFEPWSHEHESYPEFQYFNISKVRWDSYKGIPPGCFMHIFQRWIDFIYLLLSHSVDDGGVLSPKVSILKLDQHHQQQSQSMARQDWRHRLDRLWQIKMGNLNSKMYGTQQF